MVQVLFLAAALSTANVALACGGKDCAHCGTPATSTADVDVSKADGTKLTLNVSGMSCGACSKKITAALNAIEGVNAVAVSHEAGEAQIAYDAEKTNEEALIAAITALSFKAERAKES